MSVLDGQGWPEASRALCAQPKSCTHKNVPKMRCCWPLRHSEPHGESRGGVCFKFLWAGEGTGVYRSARSVKGGPGSTRAPAPPERWPQLPATHTTQLVFSPETWQQWKEWDRSLQEVMRRPRSGRGGSRERRLGPLGVASSGADLPPVLRRRWAAELVWPRSPKDTQGRSAKERHTGGAAEAGQSPREGLGLDVKGAGGSSGSWEEKA